jgi:hypothetical protein
MPFRIPVFDENTKCFGCSITRKCFYQVVQDRYKKIAFFQRPVTNRLPFLNQLYIVTNLTIAPYRMSSPNSRVEDHVSLSVVNFNIIGFSNGMVRKASMFFDDPLS